MDAQVVQIEKSIKKSVFTTNIVSVVIAIFSALGVGYGFYFNTKSTLEKHETELKELREDVNTNTRILNDIQVFKGVSSSEMKSLEKKVDKIDEKLDKLILLQQNNK